MLAYEKIDVSEAIDTNKTSVSKECMLCHYWYFKDLGFKFEPHVCNKCHDVLMTANELKNIAILNVKGVDFRCILWGISRDEAVNRLNSVLEDKGVLQMDFGANKTPVEVIKNGAFGRTYFRNIYSCISGKCYKKSRQTLLINGHIFGVTVLKFFFFEEAILIYLFMAAEASVAAAYGWWMKDKLIEEKQFRALGLRID